MPRAALVTNQQRRALVAKPVAASASALTKPSPRSVTTHQVASKSATNKAKPSSKPFTRKPLRKTTVSVTNVKKLPKRNGARRWQDIVVKDCARHPSLLADVTSLIHTKIQQGTNNATSLPHNSEAEIDGPPLRSDLRSLLLCQKRMRRTNLDGLSAFPGMSTGLSVFPGGTSLDAVLLVLRVGMGCCISQTHDVHEAASQPPLSTAAAFTS